MTHVSWEKLHPNIVRADALQPCSGVSPPQQSTKPLVQYRKTPRRHLKTVRPRSCEEYMPPLAMALFTASHPSLHTSPIYHTQRPRSASALRPQCPTILRRNPIHYIMTSSNPRTIPRRRLENATPTLTSTPPPRRLNRGERPRIPPHRNQRSLSRNASAKQQNS